MVNCQRLNSGNRPNFTASLGLQDVTLKSETSGLSMARSSTSSSGGIRLFTYRILTCIGTSDHRQELQAIPECLTAR